MKKWKRRFCVMLAFVMVLSGTSSGVLAVGESDVADGRSIGQNEEYIIEFHMNDDTDVVHDEVVALDGHTVMLLPTNPTRSGYTFIGWYTDPMNQNSSTRFNFSTIITQNHTLYARWEFGGPGVTHTIKFVSNDATGNLHHVAFVAEGQQLTAPNNPMRAGFTFAFWSRQELRPDENFTWDGEFDFPAYIDNCFSLFAVWHPTVHQHTVRFHVDDDIYAIPHMLVVLHGHTAAPPENPMREGHTFVGWYSDPLIQNDSTRFDFDTIITQDISLYARWIPLGDVHVVTFHKNDGSGAIHATTDVSNGSTVRPPINPTASGMIFRGWETVDNEQWNFGAPIIANLDLYATWEDGESGAIYTIEFWRNDATGNLHYVEFIEGGQQLTAPTDPIRKDHTFLFWNESPSDFNSDGGFAFPVYIDGNLNLYAIWHLTVHDHTVRFQMNDGTSASHDMVVVLHGYTVAPPVNPIREGYYTFMGWHTDSVIQDSSTIFNFGTPITENLTLYARWFRHDSSLPPTVTLSFHSFNSQPAIQTIEVEIGTTYGEAITQVVTPTLLIYVRPSYFDGWVFCWITPLAPIIDPNKLITEDSPREIFAAWRTQTTHGFVFQGNGGTPERQVAGRYSYLPETYFSELLLRVEQPTKLGYRFAGWFTAPTGGRQIMAIEEVLSIPHRTTLYAQWTRITTGVDSGGGGGGGSQQQQVQEIETPETPLEQLVEVRNAFIRGFEDGSFRPEQSITRAEISMILWRLIDDNTKHSPRQSRFSDVSTGWYAQAVNYLASHNIVRGFEDGTFRPNASITRAELTAVVSRFFELYHDSVNRISDTDNEHWAFSYIMEAYMRDWITSYEDDTFNPGGELTRAEAVMLLNRALGRRPNSAAVNYHLRGIPLFSDLDNTHWAFFEIMEAAIDYEFYIDEDENEIWTRVHIPTS